MPDRSNSFSLNRTVLNAAGRAPMAPMRAPFRLLTTRQVAANRRRSARKQGLSGATVWRRGERIADAVLAEVVADRHLAAEAVAAMLDRHAPALVREGVDEHRHVEVRPAQRVGHRPLVAEVRQRHEDAVDLVAAGPEQVGAGAAVGEAFDGPVRRGVGLERDRLEAFPAHGGEHVGASGGAEMRRKEAAVADDDAQRRRSSGSWRTLTLSRRPPGSKAAVNVTVKGESDMLRAAMPVSRPLVIAAFLLTVAVPPGCRRDSPEPASPSGGGPTGQPRAVRHAARRRGGRAVHAHQCWRRRSAGDDLRRDHRVAARPRSAPAARRHRARI